MERKIACVAALMGMTAIILGAFGAHALKKQLSVEQLGSFETGVKYQMYHALFLLFLGINTFLNEKVKKNGVSIGNFWSIFLFGFYLFANHKSNNRRRF